MYRGIQLTDIKQVFHVQAAFDPKRKQLFRDAELFVENGILKAILEATDKSPAAETIRREFEHAKRVNEQNAIALPGLVNSHQHAYSALARGMPITEPMPDFPSRLQVLWWRLDRALQEESIKYSALTTAIEAVRHGCTSIVDHHSSPNATRGSLDVITKAFSKFNLRSVLCHETSDRNGSDKFEQSIEENLAFSQTHKTSNRVRGLLGLHAGFTLSEQSLKEVAARRPSDLPIHIHLAEDRCDVTFAKELGYDGPLARLHAYGLLDKHSLLAHCVHLSKSEQDLAKELGVWVAHNPESNLNNRVGYAEVDQLDPNRILLGTDGMSGDMLTSARVAFLLYSAFGGGAQAPLEFAWRILFENTYAYLSEMFGETLGGFEVDQPADFAIFPYPSPTSIMEENIQAHVFYGLSNHTRARWVMAGGTVVLEDGRLTVLDERVVMQEARACAEKLWNEYKSPSC